MNNKIYKFKKIKDNSTAEMTIEFKPKRLLGLLAVLVVAGVVVGVAKWL